MSAQPPSIPPSNAPTTSATPHLFSLSNHTPILARQSSFDHDGELQLSSSQVKQRLKAHLLNRRRSSNRGVSCLTGLRRRSLDWQLNADNSVVTVKGKSLSSKARSCLPDGTWRSQWRSADSASVGDPDVEVLDGKHLQQSKTVGSTELDVLPSLSHHRSLDLPSLTSALQSFPHPCKQALASISGGSTSNVWPTRVNNNVSLAMGADSPGLDLTEEFPVTPAVSARHQDRPGSLASLGIPNESIALVTARHENGAGHRVGKQGTPLPPPEHVDVQAAEAAVALVDIWTKLNWSAAAAAMTSNALGCPTPTTTVSALTSPELRKSVSESDLESHQNPSSIENACATIPESLTVLLSVTVEAVRAKLLSQSLTTVDLPNSMDWESACKPPDMLIGTAPFKSEVTNSQVGASAGGALPERLTKMLHIWNSLPIDEWSLEESTNNAVARQLLPGIPLPTALAFDPGMLEHQCLCHNSNNFEIHPESPNRLGEVLSNLAYAKFRLPSSLNLTAEQLLHLLATAVLMEVHMYPQSVSNGHLQHIMGQLPKEALDKRVLRLVLQQIPLLSYCKLVRARMAKQEELIVFHSAEHVLTFGGLSPAPNTPSPNVTNPPFPSVPLDSGKSTVEMSSASHLPCRASIPWSLCEHIMSPRLCKLSCGGVGVDSDTVWNPDTTAKAGRLAAGQVFCLAQKVAFREVRNGFALVRPPGHHAEPNQAMGFCYFNSVAVAALNLLRQRVVSKVLILDWDIHHGNGTKLATLDHPSLLYISLHRYDNGTFFPGTGGTTEGAPTSNMTSGGKKNNNGGMHTMTSAQLVNVAWETLGPCKKPTSDVPADLLPVSVEEQTDKNSAGGGDFNILSNSELRRRNWFHHYARASHFDSRCNSQNLNVVRLQQQQPSVLRSPSESSAQHHSFVSSTSSPVSSFWASRPSSVIDKFRTTGCSAGAHESGHPTPSTSFTAFSGLSSSSFTASSGLGSSIESSLLLHGHARGHTFVRHGDAEYLAAMRCVVLPIAKEFNPDIILISAGFDAAVGHDDALGGYSVSPGAFAWMTRQCMSLVDGRVVLALEGGYNPVVVDQCVTACLNSLLLPTPLTAPYPPRDQNDASQLATGLMDAWSTANDWIPLDELRRAPCPEAVTSLTSCIQHQAKNGWRCLADIYEPQVAMSFMEAVELERRRLLLLSSTCNSQTSPFDQSTACSSPLVDNLAKLCMDHNSE